MRDLIDREALLEQMRAAKDKAIAGVERNPDDPEWDTIAECYGDMVRMVEEASCIIQMVTIGEARAHEQPEEVDSPTGWLNFYRCVHCKYEWSGEWDCQVDDDCPECGTRHMTPYKSEETSDA